MAKQYKTNPEIFKLFQVTDYIDLIIDFVGLLRPDIIIERFISESPMSLLLAPKWNLKNFEIVAKIDKKLIEKNTWQGKYYEELH
jgi:radical SAM superfamily enzyme